MIPPPAGLRHRRNGQPPSTQSITYWPRPADIWYGALKRPAVRQVVG